MKKASVRMGLGAVAAAIVLLAIAARAQVPATSSTCDRGDITDAHDTTRFNPEWAPINVDAAHPLPNNMPTILEGKVAPVPASENQNSQAPTEVSEEEIPWNHYTHDYTFKVVPDPKFEGLLASWNRMPSDLTATLPGSEIEAFQQCKALSGTYQGNNKCLLVAAETCPDGSTGATCTHEEMEVEWENGAAMHVNGDSANNTRFWGALPEYAWPSGGDRVWLEGRWIFDCGHPGVGDNWGSASDLGLLPSGTTLNDWVKFDSEIHPPRALVTYRINHTAVSGEETASSGNPYRSQSDDPSSWLPVTGSAVPQPLVAIPPWTPPTLIPVTQADIFVSGNGGGANDLCNIVSRSDSSGDCSPYHHTGPVIPINNYNYVFDIYPPGAHYESLAGNGPPLEASGAIPVTPPVPNAALQWRVIDHFNEIPEHTCGPDKSYCRAVTPVLCMIGASTPPPPSDPIAQTALGTSCPLLQFGEQATRLRVILPFNGSNANFFAKTIMLGWDDIPDGQNQPAIRRFGITLNQYTVDQNGRCTVCGNGDWRVFVDVGGQWRWMSWLYDTENGVYAFDGGDNITGHGDPLTKNGDNDYYYFTRTPWTVDVQDGRTIHVAVGGYDSGPSDGGYCDNYSGAGCDYGLLNIFGLGISDVIALARTGTYEFDLYPGDCASPCTYQIPETETERQYTTSFKMEELPVPIPPAGTLQIGDPHYNSYVSSATPFNLSSGSLGLQGFQYRFHHPGAPLPTYALSPFPVHWTSAAAANGAAAVYLDGGSNVGDGNYDFQYSAESVWNLLEARHTQSVILDNTAPQAAINQPLATQYGHGDTLTLNYNVTDAGSGVKSFTAKMDGLSAAQFGASLDSGQPVYLYSMSLGTHTFSVDSTDNVNNAGSNSVAFTITVTPQSLGQDVANLQALGCIDNIGQSLTSKIAAAANLIGKGQTAAAINALKALMYEVQAQAGKHIATSCKDPSGRSFDPVELLLSDAQYLQLSLSGKLAANPILGWVVNAADAGVSGATVNLVSSSNAVVATAITDAAGFYYFSDTSGLAGGATYSIVVALPSGYSNATPAVQTFTWSGASLVANFVLN